MSRDHKCNPFDTCLFNESIKFVLIFNGFFLLLICKYKTSLYLLIEFGFYSSLHILELIYFLPNFQEITILFHTKFTSYMNENFVIRDQSAKNSCKILSQSICNGISIGRDSMQET